MMLVWWKIILIHLFGIIILIDSIELRRNKRMINGLNTKPGQYPYTVQVRSPSDFCGGTIIKSNWVLTAARCVQFRPQDMSVVASLYVLNLSKDPHKQIIPINSVYSHPDWRNNGSQLKHDIALVNLFTSLKFNEWVHEITLPPVKSIPIGNVTVIGWGSITSNQNNVPLTQQSLTLPIIDKGSCEKIWTGINEKLSDFLQDQHMCLGTTNYDIWQGACKGDFGDPVISNSDTGHSILVAIVVATSSFCGYPKAANTIVIRISPYVDWINETIINHEKTLITKVIDWFKSMYENTKELAGSLYDTVH